MATHGMNNQGIMHLAFVPGGKPLCGRRNALMSDSIDRAHLHGRVCAKCAAKLAEMQARAAKRIATE